MIGALLCGAAVFPGLFFGFRKILKRTWPEWSDADVATVSERLVSAVHASLATAAGVTVVSSCRDVMTDSHWLVNSFVLFGAPYMLFDLYAMYLSHYHTERTPGGSAAPGGHSPHTVGAFLRKDWMLVLHHLALLLVFMPVTLFFRRGLGDFFIGCLFTTELSTPFISIGKILIQVSKGESDVFVVLCMSSVGLFRFGSLSPFSCPSIPSCASTAPGCTESTASSCSRPSSRVASCSSPSCTGSTAGSSAFLCTGWPFTCLCTATWVTWCSWRHRSTGSPCC
uniref:TLC domain containing 3A n=1 Tax=Fundulus heteroclitus TaxID=8078 RepID=A0A3Q2PZM1_FUNHE